MSSAEQRGSDWRTAGLGCSHAGEEEETLLKVAIGRKPGIYEQPLEGAGNGGWRASCQ